MNRIQKALGAATILAAISCAPSTSTAAVAYDFTPGGASLPGNQLDLPYSLGNVFTVTQPTSVTALRVFDQGGNGLGGPVEVSIHLITIDGLGEIINGSRRAAYTFSGSETYDAASGTRVQAITPVALSQGATYMVVANHMGTGVGASEVNYNVLNAAGTPSIPTDTSGTLNYGVSMYNFDPAWTQPGGWFGPDGWAQDSATYIPMYAAGNFDFTAVPEAQHFAFAGASLMGLLYVGREALLRRKQQRS